MRHLHSAMSLINWWRIIENNLTYSFYHSFDILSGRPIFLESSKNSFPRKGRIFCLKQSSLPADIRGLCGNRVIIIFLTTKQYNWRPSERKNWVSARAGYCSNAKKGSLDVTNRRSLGLFKAKKKKNLPLGVIFLDSPLPATIRVCSIKIHIRTSGAICPTRHIRRTFKFHRVIFKS